MVVITSFCIWVYLSYHTGSFFLGTLMVIQIVMSIPVTFIIYRFIFRITYFCPVHITVTIVIIGIGCDDMFVFHDQWMHTKHIKVMKKRLPLRLAYTFRRASSAMLVTSATTAVSFLSTCISPVMMIMSYGIFAAILVTVNFLLIIAILPSIYVLYQMHIRKRFRCVRWCKSKVCTTKKPNTEKLSA